MSVSSLLKLTIYLEQLLLCFDTCFKKDFLRDVLCEKKSLFIIDSVKVINIPVYDEFFIKNLLHMIIEEPTLRVYVPRN